MTRNQSLRKLKDRLYQRAQQITGLVGSEINQFRTSPEEKSISIERLRAIPEAVRCTVFQRQAKRAERSGRVSLQQEQVLLPRVELVAA